MSYAQILMSMTQNYVIAANMSINNGDPYSATMFYENINMLLPPAPEQEINESSDSEDFTIEGTTGYRVDLSEIKPKSIDKHSKKSYLTESLKSDVSQWEYLSKLSGLVMEAIGKFASDNQSAL